MAASRQAWYRRSSELHTFICRPPADYRLPGSQDLGPKADTHSNTPTPTRPHLPTVTLPGPSIHKPSQHAIQVNKRPREFSIYGTKALADFPRNLKQNEIMYRS